MTTITVTMNRADAEVAADVLTTAAADELSSAADSDVPLFARIEGAEVGASLLRATKAITDATAGNAAP
jgi:hypothetical protein